MVNAWTLCSSAQVYTKAGANASILTYPNSQTSGQVMMDWYNQAEGSLSLATGKDWAALYSSAGANFKNVLGDVMSDMIAMNVITYNLGVFTSRIEAQTMLDVLNDRINRHTKLLADENKTKRML